MASPRPAFALSNFIRAVKSCEPQTYQSIRRPTQHVGRSSKFHTTSRRPQQTSNYQRYGPAASQSLPPPPKPAEPYLPSTDQTKQDAPAEEKKQAATNKNREQEDESRKPTEEEETGEEGEGDGEGEEIVEESVEQSQPQQSTARSEPEIAKEREAKQEESEPLQNKELDMVLSIPSPSEVKGNSQRHPHLEASPYEHHFDTYSLVQDLAKEAFTEKQAITLMKAIRLMLAENLDIAKEGLVSKSDTGNETYLFRAACSELKTTMQTARFMEAQKQRSQRAQLQHEFDILSQKVSQDVAAMREELKGMFHDRKLGLEEEKRKIDSKIQQLNYEITVGLNSEAKSEVEGLRWVLTRRAALAIGSAAFMTLSFLQYYSVKSREYAEIEKKRRAAQKAQEERIAQEQARYTTPSRDMMTQTDESSPPIEYVG